MNTLQPPVWSPPNGFSFGFGARVTLVFCGWQVGWYWQQQFGSDYFFAHSRQALDFIVAVLGEAGARPEHIVRMTWYVTDRGEYLGNLRALGEAYREVIGRHYPAMTAVEVSALIEKRARVEIEATAVVPD